MDWYLKVLKQYADFEGRARRTEYWTFILVNFLIFILFLCLEYIFEGIIDNDIFTIFGSAYSLAVFIPSLAVTVRRLHDIGKEGSMILILLIPGIGVIWLFIILLEESQSLPNKYGPDPRLSPGSDATSDKQ
jgi:uncharacterized membrane protein YhaH (DUF805 family)